jgi:hypothetical protein
MVCGAFFVADRLLRPDISLRHKVVIEGFELSERKPLYAVLDVSYKFIAALIVVKTERRINLIHEK